MHTLAMLLLLPAVAAGQFVSPLDLLKENVRAADHRISYGPGELHFGELRLPKGAKGPHPVVMLVHGGCWAHQLKGNDPRATSFELLRPMAAALADAGIATWNVEYRRGARHFDMLAPQSPHWKSVEERFRALLLGHQ